MNDHDQLREQMWDLVYGLTTAEETTALHARIKSDPRIARLYAEVRLESDLLAQAARVEASVHLPDLAAPRDKPAAGRAKTAAAAAPSSSGRMALSLHWLGAAAASALALLLAVSIFWQTSEPRRDETHLVSVSAYAQGDALVSGLLQEIELEARDGEGNPVSVPLTTQIAAADGQPRYEYKVETNDSGRGNMPVPADALAAGVKLRVLHEAELLAEAPLPIRDEPLETSITLDKDWYQPGDVVRWRAVNLSAFTRQTKDAQSLQFQLHMPDDQTLAPDDSLALVGTGIVTGEFELPSDAPAGYYALTVQSTPQSEPQTEAIVSVGREAALLPQSESYFRRLRRGSAGKPMELAMRDEGKFAGGGFGGLGGEGRGGALPESDRESQRQLAARSKQTQPPSPDVANRPAAEPSASPTPAPAPAGPPRGRAALEAPAESATRSAEKSKSPAAAERFDQLAQKNEAEPSLELADKREAGKDGGLGEGDSVELAIPPEAEGKKLSVETRYRDMVLSKIQVPAAGDELQLADGKAADARRSARGIQVPLPQVTGEVEVTLFDESESMRRPLLTRRIARSQRNTFQIDLGAIKESYAPGEKVHLTVAVKDNIGQRAIPEAMLGINVRPALGDRLETEHLELAQKTDNAAEEPSSALEADRKTLGSITPPQAGAGRAAARRNADSKSGSRDLADRRDIAADLGPAGGALSAGPAPGDESAGQAVASPQELTENERRFSAPVESWENAPAEAGLPLALPQSGRKLLVSNEAQVQRVLEKREAAQTAHHAKVAFWKAGLGRLLLGGGVLMLLVLAVAFALQRPASARVWVPSLAIAAASFAVGFVWLLNQPRTGHQVAQRDFGEVADAPDAATVEPTSPAANLTPTDQRKDENIAATGAASRFMQDATEPVKTAPAPEEVPTDGTVAQRQASSTTKEIRDAEQDVAPLRKKLLQQDQQSLSQKGRQDGKPVDGPKLAGAASGDKRAVDGDSAGKDGGERSDLRPGLGKRLIDNDADKNEKKQTAEEMKDGQTAGLDSLNDAKRDQAKGKSLLLDRQQPHTIVWQPLLRADENGLAVIEFIMPAVPGDYRLVLDVHGNGRVGQLQMPLRCEALPAVGAPAAATEAKP